MKITNKIFLLTFFLLGVLAVNTWVGLRQLSKIEFELRDVVNKDILLTETITSITHHQFEKAVLFERVIRIAEEIAFEKVSTGRKEYLIDQATWIRKGFDKLADSIDKDILQGNIILQEEIQRAKDQETKQELKEVHQLLKGVEEAHRSYEMLTAYIFEAIYTGKYVLSFEDIKKGERAERALANKIKHLLEYVQRFTKTSVVNAKHEQVMAQKVLWMSVFVSIVISVIIAFSILKSIAKPLKILVSAAHQVGEGNFNVNLDVSSKDEIGEVSRAFNLMAQKLADVNAELENKNKVLADNLKITQEQKHDLEKVNRELDNFVHTVSHDIRAPLVGITGYGVYLENNYKDKFDAKGEKCLLGINRGADRLRNLIEDLLELTRISRIKNPYEHVSMDQIVQAVADRLEFNISTFNIQLDVQKNLPEVVCDRIKFTEVFSNLIGNAIKFSSKNTDKQPTVEVGCKEQESFYEFHIRDNGIGIAPENHKDVFAIFTRLHTSEEYTGTGTGLAIVKGVIEDHGGTIWIESQLGKGAVFHFTIPKNLTVMQNLG